MNKSCIKDLIIFEKSGQYGLALAAEEFEIGKPRYLRISDIDDNGNLLNTNLKSITIDDTTAYTLHQNDLVVARTGNSTGRTYMYDASDGDMVFAGFLIRYVFDERKINPRYMKYYCLSDIYRSQIKIFQGSTRGNMSAQDFQNIVVYYPDRDTQDKLVQLFDQLTLLTKLNNHRIHVIRNLVNLLYQYWFIQFDFPDKENKPYKNNGGKMVWNESLRREIPIGWEVKRLCQFMDAPRESILPQNFPEIEWEYYSIPAFDESHFPAFEKGKTIESSKYSVPQNAVLISKLNPQFKRLWRPLALSQHRICSTEFVVLVPNTEMERSYCYSLLDSDRFQKYLRQNASSSTGSRSRIQPKILMEFQEVIPPKELRKRFEKIVSPLMQLEDGLYKENMELIRLRNFLFPLLITKQVTFKEKV